MTWFDYTIDIHGATIIPMSERLSTASLSAVEIDQQVSALKRDLDRVATEMKAVIARHQSEPLGLRTTKNA